MEANEEEKQQNRKRNKDGSDELGPYLGLTGAALMGLVALTRQLERCPRGSKVLERLLYVGMGCYVLVTFIKYGHG